MILLKECQFKANLHAHSTLSDGRLTPAELKELYRSHGYRILAITDHERPCDHTDMSEEDFLLLTGYEAYIRPDPEGRYNRFRPEVHLNLFAKDPHNTDLIRPHRPYIKYVPEAEIPSLHVFGSDEPRSFDADGINEFIRAAREDGYLVSYNHPVWSMEDPARLLEYEGIFAVEMFNGASLCIGLPEDNSALYDWLLRKGKRWFTDGVDDNHNAYPIDHPRHDSFRAYTMICTEDGILSYGRVIDALEKGSFYASTGADVRFLEAEGSHIRVKTSPASSIVFYYGAKTTGVFFPAEPGGTISEAEFDLPAEAKFFHLRVNGETGAAHTRGYFREEWEN